MNVVQQQYFLVFQLLLKGTQTVTKKYCERLQREIFDVTQPVYNVELKMDLRTQLQKQFSDNTEHNKHGLKQFMTEAAYGLVILLLLIGLAAGIASLLLKLSQLHFITTKQITDWTLLNWFYCLGFSNQLWNMVNIDQLKTFT
eukprot:393382_1